MLIKKINQANVAFLEKIEEAENLAGNWLRLSRTIYIEQFSTDSRIPTKYQNSNHFTKLAKLSQTAITDIGSKYSRFTPLICTASVFVDRHGNEIVSCTQDMSKHILENSNDTLCIRELKKQQGLLKTGQGYEICPGCDTQNHSEQSAIAKSIATNKYKQLEGSILYLYNHFWCCDSCRQKLFEAGVSKIIIDPKCAWIFGDKTVEWYRGNDL